jgi:hypothetical protein
MQPISLNSSNDNLPPLQTDRHIPENGCVPFFLHEIFLTLTSRNISKNPCKGIKITPINLNDTERIEVEKIVETGRLVCAVFQNKQLAYILIHPFWLQKIHEKETYDFVKITHQFFPIGKNSFLELNNNSYHYIVRSFKLTG